MKKVRIKSSAEKGRCDGGSEDGYRWIWILSRMVNAPSRFCTGERLDRGRGEAKGIILSFPGPKIWLRLGTMKGAGGSHDDMRREGKLDPELLARNALDGAWDGQLIPGKKKNVMAHHTSDETKHGRPEPCIIRSTVCGVDVPRTRASRPT